VAIVNYIGDEKKRKKRKKRVYVRFGTKTLVPH
jgi:hypothetical protein